MRVALLAGLFASLEKRSSTRGGPVFCESRGGRPDRVGEAACAGSEPVAGELFASRSKARPGAHNLERLHKRAVGDLKVDVRQVLFTQNAISSKFRDGRDVRGLASELSRGLVRACDLPKILVFRQGGVIFSLDNRRLFAMKAAGVSTVVAQEVEVGGVPCRKLTTTCRGQFVVFSDDASIPVVDKAKVDMDACGGEPPHCLHHVELTWRSSESQRLCLTAGEVVKILAKNRLPISDHFRPVFRHVMRGLAVSCGGRCGLADSD